ncbi:MAG: hypothetical protein A3K10_16270 [Bacteroidetes bacterium RIFCSPLOWO2_12_FULL_31_6]|nr:MAG: hypothetical protein A3K10_16270 [Bacteroidetes bacterium RIFCSPLOWO2_12_FULL_31_6]
MSKFIVISFCIFFYVGSYAQVMVAPNDLHSQETNKELKAKDDFEMFNNIDHPLAITGDILTLGGSIIYIAASLNETTNYQPTTNSHYIGIAAFATGVVLFAIFSTERSEAVPKSKKTKEYKPEDWEVAPQ